MKKEFEINVTFNGEYPIFCYGHWIIKVNGIYLKVQDKPFNTLKEYCKIYLDRDFEEKTEYYKDGLECSEWIEEVMQEDLNGLKSVIELNFFLNDKEMKNLLKELYEKINEHDWRFSSCGGCL